MTAKPPITFAGCMAGPCNGNSGGKSGPWRPSGSSSNCLSEEERICSICHRIHPEIGLTEESEEIEWEVRLERVRHIRHCYLRGCNCVPGPKILTAPKPAKLIPKGLFAVSFWVEVLLKKFEFKQPIQRTVDELKTLELEVSPGTLTGGLKKIQPMLQPLVGQFVLRAREGCLLLESSAAGFCQSGGGLAGVLQSLGAGVGRADQPTL